MDENHAVLEACLNRSRPDGRNSRRVIGLVRKPIALLPARSLVSCHKPEALGSERIRAAGSLNPLGKMRLLPASGKQGCA